MIYLKGVAIVLNIGTLTLSNYNHSGVYLYKHTHNKLFYYSMWIALSG